MPDPRELDPFEDINEVVRDEWRAETTPYERIREVVSRTYTPSNAETLADAACTSPKTARKHLETLAEDGFVTTEAGANGATLYRRSAASLVVEQAADILSEVSVTELQDRIMELQNRLAEFQREYGVDSPEALTVERTNELLDDDTRSEPVPGDETIREWKTTRRNLAFANAALSIANAEKYVDTDAQPYDGTPSSP